MFLRGKMICNNQKVPTQCYGSYCAEMKEKESATQAVVEPQPLVHLVSEYVNLHLEHHNLRCRPSLLEEVVSSEHTWNHSLILTVTVTLSRAEPGNAVIILSTVTDILSRLVHA